MSARFPETITKRVAHGDTGIYGGAAWSTQPGDGAPFHVRLSHDDVEMHALTVTGRARAVECLRAWADERRAPESTADAAPLGGGRPWTDAVAAMPALADDERLETVEFARRIATDRTGVIFRNRAMAQLCCELGAALEQLQADPTRPAVSPTVVPALTTAIDYLEAQWGDVDPECAPVLEGLRAARATLMGGVA